MGHGISNERCFVYGLEGQGKDWHGLTQERPAPLTKELFPLLEEAPLFLAGDVIGTEKDKDGKDSPIVRCGRALPWRVLLAKDDGKPCGGPFNPKSFGYILPQRAWDMVMEALGGTKFSVERVGMLWDRSFWFVSVSLDELKDIARKGEMFRLNFSGGLDGNDSPQGELSHIRAVCWNTISASRNSGEYLFKIRQTIHSKDRLEDAKKEVEKAVGLAALFNKTLGQLEETPCDVKRAEQAYAGDLALHNADFVIGKAKDGSPKENRARNTVAELLDLFKNGDGNHGETVADLLNGFTQYFTRGRKDSKRDKWSVLASSEFGGNADRKADFLGHLTDGSKWDVMIAAGEEALAKS